MSVRTSARNSLLFTILLSCAVLVSGCAVSSSAQNIARTANGAIYLEHMSDRSLAADHPVVIDQQTMAKVVKGVTTDETALAPTTLPASGSKPMRVFSDEDAEFLAPLLAQGLAQAKPSQLVGFRVSPSAGSGAEPTAGTLYVREGAIHISIMSSKGILKPVGFSPRSAVRLESVPASAAHGGQGGRSLAIDYRVLAKTAVVAAPSAPQQDKPVESEGAGLTADEFLLRQMEELRRAKEAVALKESEISLLRKENTWMKEKLREQSAQVAALKAGKTASKPSAKLQAKPGAELRPTR